MPPSPKPKDEDVEHALQEIALINKSQNDQLPQASQLNFADVEHVVAHAQSCYLARKETAAKKDPTRSQVKINLESSLPNLYSQFSGFNEHPALIEEIFEHELEQHGALKGIDKDFACRSFRTIYLQMGEELVDALIEGHLPQSERANPSIGEQLLVLRQGAHLPGIYGQFIVDSKGYGLNGRELGTLLKFLQKYLRQRDKKLIDCKDIDLEGRLNSRVHLKNGDSEEVIGRVKLLAEFVRDGRRILAAIPEADREKCLPPFREFGYSHQVQGRLTQHLNAQGSNFMLQCILDCLRYLFPGVFDNEQYMLCVVTHSERASLAEVFITRLAQGYVSSFIGLSHWQAGINNQSAQRLTTETLTEARKFVEGRLPYKASVDQLDEAIEAVNTARDALIEKVAQRRIDNLYREHYNMTQKLLVSMIRLRLIRDYAERVGVNLDGVEAFNFWENDGTTAGNVKVEQQGASDKSVD